MSNIIDTIQMIGDLEFVPCQDGIAAPDAEGPSVTLVSTQMPMGSVGSRHGVPSGWGPLTIHFAADMFRQRA